jgi:hypothetical protein
LPFLVKQDGYSQKNFDFQKFRVNPVHCFPTRRHCVQFKHAESL